MENDSLFDPQPSNPGVALEVFTFPATGQQFRSLLIDNEVWFVAVDVCSVLGITNARQAVAYLDGDEVRQEPVSTNDGSGRALLTNLINEAGLYSIILRSRKPEARAFKRWVTHEVLPQIRRSGFYSVVATPTIPTHPEALRRWAAEIEAREAAEARAVAAETKVAELTPMAAQAELHRAADGLLTIGDLANKLKSWAKDNHPGVRVLHPEVWDFAGEVGLIIRNNTVRRNRATAFAIERDYIREKETVYKDSNGVLRTSHTPRLTPRGEGWLWDHATTRITETGTLRKIQAGAA